MARGDVNDNSTRRGFARSSSRGMLLRGGRRQVRRSRLGHAGEWGATARAREGRRQEGSDEAGLDSRSANKPSNQKRTNRHVSESVAFVCCLWSTRRMLACHAPLRPPRYSHLVGTDSRV